MPGDANQLQYSVEYSYLSLINNGPDITNLQGLRFVTNVDINSFSSQLPGQLELFKTQVEDFYIYTLKLPSSTKISGGIVEVIDYTGNVNCLGPLTGVQMPPFQVEVQFQNQASWQSINLNNPMPWSNPYPNIEFKYYYSSNASLGRTNNINSIIKTANFLYCSNSIIKMVNFLSYSISYLDADGNISSTWPLGSIASDLPALSLVKQRNPYLKTALSFGGWTDYFQSMDPIFSKMAANVSSRHTFVKNVVNALRQVGFTDVDIDWENIAKVDAQNFVTLLQELRSSIPTNGRLTITAPATIDSINAFSQQQWQQIATVVDSVSVTSYSYFGVSPDYADFHSPWELSPNSPHKDSDPFLCVEKTLETYQKLGFANKKLSIGIPAYGCAVFVNELGEYAGLYQPVVDVPWGEIEGIKGIYSWNTIATLLNNELCPVLDVLGVTEWNYYDATHVLCKDAKMCLLSGQLPNGKGIVLSFMDTACANWRAQEIMRRGYGGVFEWANYLDSSANSIIDAISDGLNPLKKQHADIKSKSIKPFIKSEIKLHINALQDGFFSSKRQRILQQLVMTEDVNKMTEIFDNHKKELGTHRNVFKRLFSAIFPKRIAEFIFAKPKSLRLAEEWIALKTPTRVIYRNTATPNLTLMKQSYTKMNNKIPKPVVTIESSFVPTAQSNELSFGKSLPSSAHFFGSPPPYVEKAPPSYDEATSVLPSVFFAAPPSEGPSSKNLLPPPYVYKKCQ